MCCCCRRTYDVGLVLDGSHGVWDLEPEIWMKQMCSVVVKRMCSVTTRRNPRTLINVLRWDDYACVAAVEEPMMLV